MRFLNNCAILWVDVSSHPTYYNWGKTLLLANKAGGELFLTQYIWINDGNTYYMLSKVQMLCSNRKSNRHLRIPRPALYSTCIKQPVFNVTLHPHIQVLTRMLLLLLLLLGAVSSFWLALFSISGFLFNFIMGRRRQKTDGQPATRSFHVIFCLYPKKKVAALGDYHGVVRKLIFFLCAVRENIWLWCLWCWR